MRKTVRLSEAVLATYPAPEPKPWPEQRIRRMLLYKIARISLPKRDERIFKMKYQQNRQHKEIARLLKIPLVTVQWKVNKIKRTVIHQYRTYLRLNQIKEDLKNNNQ